MRLKITISMDEKTREMLDKRCIELKINRSKYIRLILKKDVENQIAINEKTDRRRNTLGKFWTKKMEPFINSIIPLFFVWK